MANNPFLQKVQIPKIDTNTFDLGHDVKTSFKMGYLIPSPPIEVSPGDFVKIATQSLHRFAPLTSPVMHRFDARHEYYFVPMRLLFKNYPKWITQQTEAGVLPAVPFVNANGGSADAWPLLDYMGIPSNPAGAANTEKISVLPLAAYQMIYREYYRDQNLIDDPFEDIFPLADGDQSALAAELFKIRKRAWEHDYFTSCLPNAQKGDPVMIPIGSQQVVFDNSRTTNVQGVMRNSADPYGTMPAGDIANDAAGNVLSGGFGAAYDPNGTLITTDSGEATSINDLRLAYALQRLKEKLMRGGSRLTEFLRHVYGVTPQDSRLDRPEYITGVKTPIVISEVLNTTGTEEVPQGNMSGHGVGVTNGQYGSYAVKEHGYIICITSVIPRTAYQQGLDRVWSKIGDPTELIMPDMSNIGEQTVKNKEIFAFQGATGEGDFGYLPMYAEYRTMRNFTTGEFKTAGLKSWTNTRVFATPPALNQEFVECTPSTDIFAVTAGADHIYCHIYHDIKVNRKLPKFGTPK